MAQGRRDRFSAEQRTDMWRRWKEIARRTVRFYKYRIMEELGIVTNSDLVKYAIRHGMISAA